jgi:hypothetical protein
MSEDTKILLPFWSEAQRQSNQTPDNTQSERFFPAVVSTNRRIKPHWI